MSCMTEPAVHSVHTMLDHIANLEHFCSTLCSAWLVQCLRSSCQDTVSMLQQQVAVPGQEKVPILCVPAAT